MKDAAAKLVEAQISRSRTPRELLQEILDLSLLGFFHSGKCTFRIQRPTASCARSQPDGDRQSSNERDQRQRDQAQNAPCHQFVGFDVMSRYSAKASPAMAAPNRRFGVSTRDFHTVTNRKSAA